MATFLDAWPRLEDRTRLEHISRVSMILPSLAMPFLRRIDPERAHDLAIVGLRAGLGGRPRIASDSRLVVRSLGLTFANPIGLAAGFDKDAEVLGPLGHLGFGSI